MFDFVGVEKEGEKERGREGEEVRKKVMERERINFQSR